MWAWILSEGIPLLLGLFGFKKDPGVSPEEKLGKAETENEGLRNYVDVEGRAAAARDRVVDDPSGVRNDPDNAGPAARP